MYKLKTHSGMSKRSQVKSGGLKVKAAYARHKLSAKSSKQKRLYRKKSFLQGKQLKNIIRIV